MLEGLEVNKYFGGLPALKNVNFFVGKGEIVGLIGPNGSGKTTLFNVISGFYKPTSGSIKFKGIDIVKLKPHQICEIGVGRTFQIVKPFLNFTVLENVLVGALYGRKKTAKISEARDISLSYLDFINLSDKKDVLVKNLNVVERKKLEIARALATDPEIILLDEPLSGLNPTETIEACNVVRRIRNELGVTVFWIEHVMRAIMSTVERIIVLCHGEKIAEGKSLEISREEKVIEAYLGKEEE